MIDSCDGCGACCEVVSRPPFYRVFDENGEDAWERLKTDRPDSSPSSSPTTGLVARPEVRITAHLVSGSTGQPSMPPLRISTARLPRVRNRRYDCRDARRRAGIG